MTNLDRRGVTRETNVRDPIKRVKPLVIRLEEGGRLLKIKPKGTRKWYVVPYADIYRLGCHLRAREIRQEKADAKKARREARA